MQRWKTRLNFLCSRAVRLFTAIRPLHPRDIFRISRAERAVVRNVFLRIEDDDGFSGHGEASPNPFYGETADDVNCKLRGAAPWLQGQTVRTTADIERVWREIWPLVQPSRAAQCALDLALWDLAGQRAGGTVTELALGRKPESVQTFCTLGLSGPDELPRKIAALAGFPLIKIKSDHAANLDLIRAVRRESGARLAVDANCAWLGHGIPALSRELAAIGVEFIEQPLPPDEHARMPGILAESALPVFADESCVTAGDVERMRGHFSGFNIKLVKCGGLTPALAMLAAGRRLGLRVMVGCMLESSLLIAAGAVLGQGTDYADLDGAWLLRDDPVCGWQFENGTLRPPDGPGLGVAPGELAFTECRREP